MWYYFDILWRYNMTSLSFLMERVFNISQGVAAVPLIHSFHLQTATRRLLSRVDEHAHPRIPFVFGLFVDNSCTCVQQKYYIGHEMRPSQKGILSSSAPDSGLIWSASSCSCVQVQVDALLVLCYRQLITWLARNWDGDSTCCADDVIDDHIYLCQWSTELVLFLYITYIMIKGLRKLVNGRYTQQELLAIISLHWSTETWHGGIDPLIGLSQSSFYERASMLAFAVFTHNYFY
jgi:hypothetical protein